MTRQSRDKAKRQDAAASRAQGECPLPSLGRIDLPPLPPPALDATCRAFRPKIVAPLPAARSRDSAGADAHDNGYGSPPPPTPEQLALERELSGAVFSDARSSPAARRAERRTRRAPIHGTRTRTRRRRRRVGSGELAPLLMPAGHAGGARAVLPTQRLLLPKGAFIDCTLETAIDSTLPGMTTCVTATDTFGVDGKVVLLERGTKLIGETRGQVQQGSGPRLRPLDGGAHARPAWSCRSISPGADELGRSGLAGRGRSALLAALRRRDPDLDRSTAPCRRQLQSSRSSGGTRHRQSLGLAGRDDRGPQEHGQHSAHRRQAATGIASRSWSRGISISGRSMSCEPPADAASLTRRRAASALALDAACACGRCSSRSGGHGAVHQPAAGGVRRDPRRLAPRAAAVRRLRLVPAVREARGQFDPAAHRCDVAAAVRLAARRRADADRAAAGDQRRLRRDRIRRPSR